MATRDQPGLSRLETIRGMRHWQLSSAFSSVYSAITAGAYATGFALYLGASDALVGLLSAAPAWGQTLQLAAPLVIERVKSRRRLCLVAYGISWSLWLPMAFIPWLVPTALRAWVFVLAVLCSGLLTAAAAPAVTSWFSDLVPPDHRAGYVSRNQSVVAGIGLVASLAAGWLLDAFAAREQAGFVLLFCIAVLAAWGSLLSWGLVPDPPTAPANPPRLRDTVRLPWRALRLRNFTIFVAMRTFAVFIAAPFFATYMLKDLQIPYSRIALFSMAVTVMTILSNPVWASLADRFSHRPLFRISCFGVTLIPFLWFWTSPTNYLIVIPLCQLYGGVIGAGTVQTQFNLLLKLTPRHNRSIYLGFHSAVVSAAMGLGSLVGGWLSVTLEGLGPFAFLGRPISHYQVLFLIASLCRLLSMLGFRLVREPDAVSTRTVLRELGHTRALGALWHLHRLSQARDPRRKARAAEALGRARSRLPVRELIARLGDPDHDVRRESARALGEIGDEEAVEPLLAQVRDVRGDLVEEALEALANIPGEAGRRGMIALLGDPRPTVRRGAAVALGRCGQSEDAPRLEAAAQEERDPSVLLALNEALSRLGGPRALRRLRRQLALTPPGPARHQIANAVSNLLGPPGAFYPLLEAEPLAQELRLQDLLKSARRTLAGLGDLSRNERAALAARIDAAGEALAAEDYRASMRTLRRVAARAVQALADGRAGYRLLADHPEFHPELTPGEKRHLLLVEQVALRLPFSYLHSLDRAATHRELEREEALLGVFAFHQVAGELAAMARGRR